MFTIRDSCEESSADVLSQASAGIYSKTPEFLLFSYCPNVDPRLKVFFKTPGLTQSHTRNRASDYLYPGSEDFLKIQFPCSDIITITLPPSSHRNRFCGSFRAFSLSYYNYRKYFIVLNYVDCLDTSLNYTPAVFLGLSFSILRDLPCRNVRNQPGDTTGRCRINTLIEIMRSLCNNSDYIS